MQLILAIDSDPRQAEELASLVHARLRVDLVQATSAGEGLHALKDRIPDLILTAPLLSPFDDGVLDEYLRDLGAAGAHVQTVRIPVLKAAPKKKGFANKLFSRGRTMTTSAAAPDGCDPKVFADEVAAYLSRAAEARQNMPRLAQEWSSRQDEATPSPVVASPVVDDAPVMNDAFIEEFAEAIELPEAHIAEPRYIEASEASPDVMSEPTQVEAETMPDAEQMMSPAADRKAPSTSATFEAALAAIRAAWVKPDAPATSPAAAVTPRSASQGEVDLTKTIDALDEGGGGDRHDSGAGRYSSPDSPPTPPAQREVDQEKTQPELGRSPETGASDQRPLQDEWGIFDPDQCGFSALVDKLDEVADSKEAPNRPVAMTRGILFQVSADERVVTGEQARHACSDRGNAMSSSGQQPATDPRRTSRSERGAALIEAAMTLPLLLLVCIGIIEFGRLYQTWQVMTNAAREGARIAVLPAPVNGGVDTRVREYLQMGGLKSDSSVGVNVAPADVSLGAGGTASGSRVTVTYPFSFMVLQPIAQLVVSGATAGAPITLTSSATMRNESQF